MYACIYIHIHMYIHICIYMNVCIYVYMCVNIYNLTEEKPKGGYNLPYIRFQKQEVF